MTRLFSLLILMQLLCSFQATAQRDSLPYDRKEEYIFDSKRYRRHNNYLTFGGGVMSSSIRPTSQEQWGADFTFHIRWQHFQIGTQVSGESFRSNNDVLFRVGYGKRYEARKYNLGIFGGPTYNYGVKTLVDVDGIIYPDMYDAFGLYISAQAVYKLAYDIGIGVELTGCVNQSQSNFGFKLILFFSGSYRGPKKPFNPHVRAENPR